MSCYVQLTRKFQCSASTQKIHTIENWSSYDNTHKTFHTHTFMTLCGMLLLCT